MNTMNCEHVSDLLPEYSSGQLDGARAEAVRLHLAACEMCASERVLVTKIRQHRGEPRELLEQRIVAAMLHRGTRTRSRSLLALAATITLAVIGGSILLTRLNGSGVAPASVQPIAEAEQHGPGWIGVDAALVSGAATLQDLSVEELEQLLVEVGS